MDTLERETRVDTYTYTAYSTEDGQYNRQTMRRTIYLGGNDKSRTILL